MNIIKKIFYMIAGSILLVIGIITSVIPLIPGTVFLGLSAICFTKGSKRFKKYLEGTKIYKKYLEKYMKKVIDN
ncbi:DUF454 family protein [Clostridium sp.]|uniref:DUF454 family protein n=1 Tax=Clostridium sp. TaxID=1506 RepID=UPI002FC97480